MTQFNCELCGKTTIPYTMNYHNQLCCIQKFKDLDIKIIFWFEQKKLEGYELRGNCMNINIHLFDDNQYIIAHRTSQDELFIISRGNNFSLKNEFESLAKYFYFKNFL